MNTYYLEHIDIPTTLVLAIMATLGYVFGTISQRRKANSTTKVMRRLRQDLSAQAGRRRTGKSDLHGEQQHRQALRKP